MSVWTMCVWLRVDILDELTFMCRAAATMRRGALAIPYSRHSHHIFGLLSDWSILHFLFASIIFQIERLQVTIE